MSKLIYLASPYTHKDRHIMQLRHMLITYIGSCLIEEGHHIFGPITESFQYAAVNPNIDGKWEFWQKHDLLMIDKCDEVWVVTLAGWEHSVGVQAEIEYAREHNKAIRYIRPEIYIDTSQLFEVPYSGT